MHGQQNIKKKVIRLDLTVLYFGSVMSGKVVAAAVTRVLSLSPTKTKRPGCNSVTQGVSADVFCCISCPYSETPNVTCAQNYSSQMLDPCEM